MNEQKEPIPAEIQGWINAEKERLRPSGLDVRVYELGLKDMYRKLDFSALRSEKERLKRERDEYRVRLESLENAFAVIGATDTAYDIEKLLAKYPNPTT